MQHLAQTGSPVPSPHWKGRTGTILLLFLEILTLTIPVFVLGNTFQFPDILREPAAKAFALFRANQSVIVPAYYGMLLSALLYIPLSYRLPQTLQVGASTQAQNWLTGLGLATAILQAFGFSRWIFLMPYLTEQYFVHPEWRNTLALLYETMNRYAGMTIGEHLGFLAMGGWTLALSGMLRRHPAFGSGWALGGAIIGFLLIASTVEHFGGAYAGVFGMLNFLANSLWTVWLLGIGGRIIRGPGRRIAPRAEAPMGRKEITL